MDEPVRHEKEILLVEDNPADIRLTREAFREAKIAIKLHVVEDGMAAMAYLHQRPPYSDVNRPDLILLDLNLPKLNGREVLTTIKTDDALKCIPVVILSTSQAEDDIMQSYNLHANCFITKPVDLNRFIEVLKHIEQFWLNDVRLPTI